jgi:hypothetical protein
MDAAARILHIPQQLIHDVSQVVSTCFVAVKFDAIAKNRGNKSGS